MRYRSIKYSLVAMLIVITLSATAGCSLRSSAASPAPPVNASQIPAVQTTVVPSDQLPSNNADYKQSLPDFADLIARARPSVVAINTESAVSGFFGRSFTQEGAGSGWIIDGSGLIVTNNHVIEGANSVTVTLEDGRAFPAQNVKSDVAADLAVIKIGANNLPAMQVGNSSDMEVGNWVVAIGNSLGLGISATKGIVSALNVSVSDSSGVNLDNLIQTDAAINPGNSGGPLMDLSGDVIGINCAKVSQVGVEGMGYALSINEAMGIIDRLETQISR